MPHGEWHVRGHRIVIDVEALLAQARIHRIGDGLEKDMLISQACERDYIHISGRSALVDLYRLTEAAVDPLEAFS
jgi:hypothetical protein